MSKEKLISGERPSPIEWAFGVYNIKPEALRGHVACVVWWDFFAHRQVKKRWSHLDRFMAEYDEVNIVDPYLIEAELIKLGYHKRAARERSGVIRKN